MSSLTLVEQFDQTWRIISDMISEQNFFPETGRRLLEDLIARAEAELEPSPEKDALLEGLRFRRDGFAILAYAVRRPPELHDQLKLLIANASPSELAQCREQLDQQTRSICERHKKGRRPPNTSR